MPKPTRYRDGAAASPRPGGLDHRFPRVQWLASRSARRIRLSYRRRPSSARPAAASRKSPAILPWPTPRSTRLRRRRPARSRTTTDSARRHRLRRCRRRRARGRLRSGSHRPRLSSASSTRAGGVARAGRGTSRAVVPRAGLRWQSLPEVQLAIAGVQDAARALLAAATAEPPRPRRARVPRVDARPRGAGRVADLADGADGRRARTPCSTSSSTPSSGFRRARSTANGRGTCCRRRSRRRPRARLPGVRPRVAAREAHARLRGAAGQRRVLHQHHRQHAQPRGRTRRASPTPASGSSSRPTPCSPRSSASRRCRASCRWASSRTGQPRRSARDPFHGGRRRRRDRGGGGSTGRCRSARHAPFV